jgi:nitrite reductase/ring-hydroxylating ferredoxin subunit
VPACRPAARLDQFLDLSRTQILCANHSALFRIDDGLCVHGPCEGRSLVAIPIEVVDGDIVIARD